jgi:AraC-like DNA-binding protein
MEAITYEFDELESDLSFNALADFFGGKLKGNTIQFNNDIGNGELVRCSPEEGLHIRKWKLNVFKKVVLRRRSVISLQDPRYALAYFINPNLFKLRSNQREVRLSNYGNNIYLPHSTANEFSVIPNQPFYVLVVSFTAKWLNNQFIKTDSASRCELAAWLQMHADQPAAIPCLPRDYRVLNEMDRWLGSEEEQLFIIRSRAYDLISSFLDKVFNKSTVRKMAINYDQVIEAESLLVTDLHKVVKTYEIAAKVNMSPAALARQFKQLYGLSMNQYLSEKRLEAARRLIIDHKMAVKSVAKSLGYKHASPFIQSFTKKFGCSPGSLHPKHSR